MLRHAANPRAAMEARDGAGRTPLAAAAAAGKHETVSAVARELMLEADDGDGDGVGGNDDDDDAENDGENDGENGGESGGESGGENGGESLDRPPPVYSFSTLEWSAYDARAETVRAVARCGGHTRRDYKRAARVAKTRRAKGPVLRLLSRGRQ